MYCSFTALHIMQGLIIHEIFVRPSFSLPVRLLDV